MNELTEDFAITTVAEHFDVPISTLHYWERQGLLLPHRRAGRRYYSREQVYRIALIKLWRTTGLLGLTDIAGVLDRDDSDGWRDIVTTRMAAIRTEMETLATAYDYLDLLLDCRQRGDLAQCPGFRASIAVPVSRPGSRR